MKNRIDAQQMLELKFFEKVDDNIYSSLCWKHNIKVAKSRTESSEILWCRNNIYNSRRKSTNKISSKTAFPPIRFCDIFMNERACVISNRGLFFFSATPFCWGELDKRIDE